MSMDRIQGSAAEVMRLLHAERAVRGRADQAGTEEKSGRVRGKQHGEGDEEPSQASEVGGERTAQRGVIRLLREGHFKGVAELRLRINFHEELAALDESARSEAASPALAALAEGFTKKASELASGLPAEDAAAFTQALDDFAARVAEVRDGMTRGAVSLGEVDGKLLAAFSELTAVIGERFGDSVGIATPLSPNETPIVGDDTAGEASVDSGNIGLEENLQESDAAGENDASPEMAFDATSFLADLRQVFADALQGFHESLDTSAGPPSLSPPSGGGKAYEKFLAVYRSISGDGDAVVSTYQETMDVTA